MGAESPSLAAISPTIADRFWQFAQDVPADASPVDVIADFLIALRRFLEDDDRDIDYSEATELLLGCLRRRELDGDLTYASPEQARGERVDERSLVFSVGVLLFERLTGRHPFGVEGREERAARLKRRELASGVNYFPQIPAELRTIIVKAIAAFPEERWHNLSDLERQLTGFLQLANTDVGRRVLAQRKLPALPETQSALPSGPRQPLRADSSIDHRFLPVLTREVQLERLVSEPSPSQRRLAGGLVVGAGLLLLTTVPLGLFAGSSDSPEAPTKASSKTLSVTLETLTPPAPSPKAPRAAALAPAAEDSQDNANTANDDRIEPAEKETVDDPVLSAALSCFTPQRLTKPIYFGASLIFDAESRQSKRAFLGGASKLSGGEKGCLSKSLVGLTGPSGPLDQPISYNIMVAKTGSFARAKQ